MKLRSKSLYPVITREFKDLAELANVVELSTVTVKKILHGSRPFTRQEKRRICKYLGLPMSKVFEDEEDEPDENVKPVEPPVVPVACISAPLGSVVSINGINYKLDLNIIPIGKGV